MLDLKFLLLKSYKDQRLKFVKKWQTKTIPPIPDLRCQSMVRVKFWTVIGKNSKGKDMVRGEYIQCSWNQLCDVTSLWYIPHRRRGGGLATPLYQNKLSLDTHSETCEYFIFYLRTFVLQLFTITKITHTSP